MKLLLYYLNNLKTRVYITIYNDSNKYRKGQRNAFE